MGVEELIAGPGGSREEVAPVDGVRAFVFLAGMRWLREQGYEDLRVVELPEHRTDDGFALRLSWV